MNWDAVSGIAGILSVVIATAPYLYAGSLRLRHKPLSPRLSAILKWWGAVILAIMAGYALGRGFPRNPNRLTGQELPTPIQQLQNWRLVYSESFTNNDAGWPVNKWQNDYVSANLFIEKRYRIEANAFPSGGLGGELWAENLDTGENFYLEADLQKLRGDEASGYGLMLHYNRSENSSYYYFQIRNNRTFLVSVKERANVVKLVAGSSDAIVPGEVNTLGVMAEATHYTFYINGAVVGEIDDPRVKGGKNGFLITVNSNEDCVVEMDNLKLYAP